MSVVDDPLLVELKRQIKSRTGLACYEDREGALTEKIGARMRALGVVKYSDYLAMLSETSESSEWHALIDEITVGETFFFRYPAQWDALRDVVIPERRASLGEAPLKILCAGCANGAEPYSLSMLLHLDLDHAGPVAILGVDISRSRIAQAESRAFGAWDLRATPERYRACFEANGAGWLLKGEFKKGVEFRTLNLVDEGASFAARHASEFDIVLCRNVMIYFSAETNRRLLTDLHACLKEGGWFVAGHAEPYLEISNVFRPEPASGAMLYRKLGATRTESPTPLPAAPAFTRTQARPGAGWSAVTASASPMRSRRAPEDADSVRRLANAGAWREAVAACDRLAVADPLNPEIQFLTALICAHTGDVKAQLAALKRAIYLDADFALAHYHLALASASHGDVEEEARSLRNVFESLESKDDGSPIACGDGLTAGDLRQLARIRLAPAGRMS